MTEPSQVAQVRTWSLIALLVIAIGLAVVWRAGLLGSSTSRVVFRSTDVELLSPAGAVESVNEFSWKSSIPANRYRVRVTRGADSVFYGETAALKISVSPELFEQDVEYRWVVEVVDGEGDVMTTSPPGTFRIK